MSVDVVYSILSPARLVQQRVKRWPEDWTDHYMLAWGTLTGLSASTTVTLQHTLQKKTGEIPQVISVAQILKATIHLGLIKR